MAMGVVDSSDFEQEIANLSKPVINHLTIKRGRGNTNEVPETLRKVIADEVITNETPAKEVSKVFGVSPSSISAYKQGATSTSSYNNPETELARFNRALRNKIIGKANTKLEKAIDSITDDKLTDAKLKDLASVASAMANVVEKISPKTDINQQNVQINIYQPRMKEEQDYEIIEVSD